MRTRRAYRAVAHDRSRGARDKVDRNLAWVPDGGEGHNRPGAIRLLRNAADNHVHVFRNDASRVLILRNNAPDPVVK